MKPIQIVLVTGASCSIGRLVVEELTERSTAARVLVRDASEACSRRQPRCAPATSRDRKISPMPWPGSMRLSSPTARTAGRTSANPSIMARSRNVLTHAGDKRRIALITAIGVTDHNVLYNLTSRVHG